MKIGTSWQTFVFNKNVRLMCTNRFCHNSKTLLTCEMALSWSQINLISVNTYLQPWSDFQYLGSYCKVWQSALQTAHGSTLPFSFFAQTIVEIQLHVCFNCSFKCQGSILCQVHDPLVAFKAFECMYFNILPIAIMNSDIEISFYHPVCCLPPR